MIGLIRGVFGSGSKNEAPAQQETQSQKPVREKPQAYFLDTDDARTVGDANYMRTAKTVRRTFPKTVNNEEMEFEREISSMNMSDRKLGTQVPKLSMGSIVTSTPAQAATGSSSNGSVPSDAEVAQRRKSDSSLEMFRDMAKNIRK